MFAYLIKNKVTKLTYSIYKKLRYNDVGIPAINSYSKTTSRSKCNRSTGGVHCLPVPDAVFG